MKRKLNENINEKFLSRENKKLREIYDKKGFVILENQFSVEELILINDWVRDISKEDLPGMVFEKNSHLVRSINGAHLNHKGFLKLCCLPRLILPVINLLKQQVYVHQFKINFKYAFEGDIWDWHQDYIFWLKEDGMPMPNVLTAVIFLDDVTEFNAPIFLVPGSHKLGTIDVDPQQNTDLPADAPAWLSNITAQLKYAASRDVVKQVVLKNGIFSAKGKAGTVLLFNGNVFHASGVNISPFDRKMILITYNRVDNALKPMLHPRPEFIASREPMPLNPNDDKLF